MALGDIEIEIMKTAKEYAENIRLNLGNGLRFDGVTADGRSVIEIHVEEIVLDAFKAGMSRAADIVEYKTQVAVFWKNSKACAKAALSDIKTTRDNIKIDEIG